MITDRHGNGRAGRAVGGVSGPGASKQRLQHFRRRRAPANRLLASLTRFFSGHDHCISVFSPYAIAALTCRLRQQSSGRPGPAAPVEPRVPTSGTSITKGLTVDNVVQQRMPRGSHRL